MKDWREHPSCQMDIPTVLKSLPMMTVCKADWDAENEKVTLHFRGPMNHWPVADVKMTFGIPITVDFSHSIGFTSMFNTKRETE